MKRQISVIFEKKCYINDLQIRRVRDHCHYTGKYRRTAHSICNLKYCIPRQL